MAKPAQYSVVSAADLEIAILHESHALMADLISSFLYSVVGDVPEQMVQFKTRETFTLFSIRVIELISGSLSSARVAGVPQNLSLLEGVKWVSERISETRARKLLAEVSTLDEWLDTKDVCHFWCGGLSSHFTFSVRRRNLWNFYGNSQKHSFLRLQMKIEQLSAWCVKANQPVVGSAIFDVLASFGEWLDGYADYHSSRFVELIGHVFAALNEVIAERWEANGRANDSRIIQHPSGVSEFFEGLHTQVLVGQHYSHERIWDLIPETADILRRPYGP